MVRVAKCALIYQNWPATSPCRADFAETAYLRGPFVVRVTLWRETTTPNPCHIINESARPIRFEIPSFFIAARIKM